MEEEDALLGLVPASMPVHADDEVNMTLPSLQGNSTSTATTATYAAPHGAEDGGEVPWGFADALQAETAHDGSDSDNGSESDADGDAVDFHDGGAASSGNAGGSVAHGDAGMDDDALLRIDDKKQAKRLGKALYKRWKKLVKKSKKSKSHKKESSKSSKKDKEADKKKKKEKEKKEKKSSRKKASSSGGSGSRKRKARDEDDEEDMYDDDDDALLDLAGGDGEAELGLVPAGELSAEAAAIEARLQKAAVREAKMRTEKATKKAAQRKTTSAEVIAIAKDLVVAMAKARRMDDEIIHGRTAKPGVYPLHRVALKELVQARCRQAYMVGPLVEAGILQELSYWLYDVDRAEAAPYELRTAALNALLTFPLEGSIAMSEDLTQFMGISREHLIKTDIGRALNALRRYPEETVDNRGKCVQLLTAFSRVISGRAEREQQADENKSKAVWKCQRDPTVASPFEVLETCSEALQKTFMKPDPRDPTSYNGLLPWRPPAATITNVSGTLSNYIEKAAS